MNVGETHLNYWYKRHCKFASFDRLERLFHSGESRAAAALAFHFGRRRKSGLKKMEIESSLSLSQQLKWKLHRTSNSSRSILFPISFSHFGVLVVAHA